MAVVPAPAMHGASSARVVLRTVLIVVLVVISLWLIYLLRQPLTWIFIAGFLAIALSGPVDWLHRRTKRRGLSIALVYLGLILFPVLLAAILVPPVVTELNNLINKLPGYARDLQDFVERNETLRRLEEDYNITAELQKQASSLTGRVGDAAGILSDIGLGLVNSIFAGVSIIILSLFMLGSGRSWLAWFARRQDPEREVWLNRLFDRIGNAVGNYVAGALLQALVAGVLAFLVLTILGVPYAGSLAVLIFVLDLIPLVGATIVAIITLFQDFPTATIIWVVWSIVYQQFENSVIQPRIQARAVQIHPFIVLTSVLFGSTLFGIMGALLAIPVAAAIQIAVLEYNLLRNPPEIGSVQAPPPPSPGPA